jgi:hypothetical protein
LSDFKTRKTVAKTLTAKLRKYKNYGKYLRQLISIVFEDQKKSLLVLIDWTEDWILLKTIRLIL